jgi:hypothetical protein
MRKNRVDKIKMLIDVGESEVFPDPTGNYRFLDAKNTPQLLRSIFAFALGRL